MLPWMSDATLTTLRRRGGEVFPDLLNTWLVATAQIFAKQEIQLVVDWHFPADAELRDLVGRLAECPLACRVFNLRCSPEEHLRRDQLRPVDEQVGSSGIEYFRTQGSWVDSPWGTDIDTTLLSPRNVAETILEAISGNGTSSWQGGPRREQMSNRANSATLRFLTELTRQTCGGQPLLASLRALQADFADQPLGAVVGELAGHIEQGSTLSGAMAKHPEVFSQAVLALVGAGETAGVLDHILTLIVECEWRYPGKVL